MVFFNKLDGLKNKIESREFWKDIGECEWGVGGSDGREIREGEEYEGEN